MEKVIDGKLMSEEIRAELKQSIKFEMIKPSIAVIQIGDNDASNSYIKAKEKACDEVGIYFRHFKYELGTSELTGQAGDRFDELIAEYVREQDSRL